MKISFALLAFLIATNCCFAQKETTPEEPRGFDKSRLFTGGGVNLSFFNGASVLGISPHFGYSVNRWLDVAIAANVNYISQRDYIQYGDKVRQTTFGPGAFVRIFPVNFLYAHAQFEYNFINLRYIPVSGSGYAEQKEKLSAPSFLVGGGYCMGREDGQTYFYTSLLFDVAKRTNSPYVDGQGRVVPIIRAGINIPLFQGASKSAGR